MAHKSEGTHNICIHVTLLTNKFLSFMFLPLGQMIRLPFFMSSTSAEAVSQWHSFTLHLMAPIAFSLQCTVLWVERYCWLRE